MGEVIVITSGKGGVGKTTTTANIGTGLAKLGKKVVMIDLKELDIVKFESVEFKQYERVARLLEPYISIVTDKFAAYMSSKGSMRIPEELFTEKFFIDNSEDE